MNLAVAGTAIQVASAKVSTAPLRPAFKAPSVAEEASSLQSLRTQPSWSFTAKPGAAPVAPGVVTAPAELPISGKGMWIWLFNEAEGGNPARIVQRARQLGLSHLYVRSSSTVSGLRFLADIDRIVPVAHAAGLKVLAWDFPTLADPNADVHRLIAVLDHRTRGGERVDGIAVDLETPSEGVHLTTARAESLAVNLRRARPHRFRVLVPPRPSPHNVHTYPFAISKYFDAIAPMVYWINHDPVALVKQSIDYLKRFHRPIAPIGQAYDPAEDGGPQGSPSGAVLADFASAARLAGAVGVSFWSWQHATHDEFRAIARMPFPVVHAPRPHGVSQADAEPADG